MTIIDVPFEPFVRRGENYVSYWDVSAARTHYVRVRGNTELERSLEVGVPSRKGIRYAVHNIIQGTLEKGPLLRQEDNPFLLAAQNVHQEDQVNSEYYGAWLLNISGVLATYLDQKT
jgi:hypothetical protein